MSSPEQSDGSTASQWPFVRPLFPRPETGRVAESLRRAAQHLLGLQKPQGFWLGELEADSSLESDAIFLDHYLGAPQPHRVRKLAASLLEQQSSEGGWALYPGGSPSVSLTVKA
ncbi:MAG: squalene--hopene cyclase, partial [Acidobacteria bacterium]|nr:squalene--hopene cyclase [Acidobacteriota bacterium]